MVESEMSRLGLATHEPLSMTSANYIAGAKAIFEFIPCEHQKTGRTLKVYKRIEGESV